MPQRYYRGAGALAGLAIAGLVQLSSSSAAFAAQNESPSGWEVAFDSYLWISSVTGTTSTSNPNIPTSKSTIKFGSLFSHLNSVPLIGAFEARNGRFGVLTDLMVISLSDGSSSNGEAFSGGSAKLIELISTILPNYRVFQTSHQTIDVGVGVRTFAFWSKLTRSMNPPRVLTEWVPSLGRSDIRRALPARAKRPLQSDRLCDAGATG